MTGTRVLPLPLLPEPLPLLLRPSPECARAYHRMRHKLAMTKTAPMYAPMERGALYLFKTRNPTTVRATYSCWEKTEKPTLSEEMHRVHPRKFVFFLSIIFRAYNSHRIHTLAKLVKKKILTTALILLRNLPA